MFLNQRAQQLTPADDPDQFAGIVHDRKPLDVFFRCDR
jgi:hypothetical protein